MPTDERSTLLRGAVLPLAAASAVPELQVAAGVASGLAGRRWRRGTRLLQDVLGLAMPPPKTHAPMSNLGSFLFLSNLILGPGILGLPAAFRYSGALTTVGLTFAFATVSVLACVFIAHACRIYKAEGAMAHTLTHAPHLEMENLVRGVSSTPMWWLFQAFFLASMVLMAVSCIVVTAQGCDALLLLLTGNAWGLQVTPSPRFVSSCPVAWTCAGRPAFEVVANENGTLISLGYLLVVALTAPLSLVDVSEEFQFASFAISLACLLWLVGKFFSMAAVAHEHHVQDATLPPAWQWNAGLALEVSFWSWTISFAVPMWLDEKDSSAPLAAPLIASFSHRALLDVLLGYAGAAAFPHLPRTTLNVLQAVGVHPACGPATQVAGVLFVVSSLVSNIVDYAMVAVRNLEAHVGATAAALAGVALPFCSAWLFYVGASFSQLVNLASPVLNGAVQFVVPAVLFWAYARSEKATHLQMLGLRAATGAWRGAAAAVAVGTVVLVAAAYVLTAAASVGSAAAAAAASAQDYVATAATASS